jgi:hypothetical protein
MSDTTTRRTIRVSTDGTSGPYHRESWRLIKKVVRDVTSAAIGRLSK